MIEFNISVIEAILITLFLGLSLWGFGSLSYNAIKEYSLDRKNPKKLLVSLLIYSSFLILIFILILIGTKTRVRVVDNGYQEALIESKEYKEDPNYKSPEELNNQQNRINLIKNKNKQEKIIKEQTKSIDKFNKFLKENE